MSARLLVAADRVVRLRESLELVDTQIYNAEIEWERASSADSPAITRKITALAARRTGAFATLNSALFSYWEVAETEAGRDPWRASDTDCEALLVASLAGAAK